MKVPGFTRQGQSRRRPDGWLVRISVRLSINDEERLGNETEAVRTKLALRVAEATRPGDTRSLVARDEYLMVIRPGRRSSDSDDPLPVVSRFLAAMAEPVESSIGPIFPRLNAAFTRAPCLAADQRARAALAEGLHAARQAGSGMAAIFDPETGATKQILIDTPQTTLIDTLKRAIDANRVVLHYQPVIRLADGRLTAFEALMRIESSGELLSPAAFIETAERSGLIHELGRVAMRKAASQMREWRATGAANAPARIAVNVSPSQLAADSFVAETEKAFAEVGLNALTLELTESARIQEMPQAEMALERLRDGGAWVALDDFGVEYSNLSYLRDLEVDIVKIDRSFLDGGSHVARAVTILAKIVELAHLLDAQVVAEGVASAEQAEALANLGIDFGQGEHFGLPMAPDAAASAIFDQAEPPSAESNSGEIPSVDRA